MKSSKPEEYSLNYSRPSVSKRNKRKNQEKLDSLFDLNNISRHEHSHNFEVGDISSYTDDFEINSSVSDDEGNITREKEFSLEDATNYISAIFLKNNVSKSLGKDIFSISKVLSLYPCIKLTRIYSKLEEWSDHDSRVYTYCSSCSSLLSQALKCGNSECSRYLIPQNNVSGNKTIVTFSIRKQLEDLLKNGAFDPSFLNQAGHESLCTRVCDTPKFKKAKKYYESLRPDCVTLLLSLNTDGFRRKGTKRGEFWPLYLAAHDISNGTGSYQEYRPEFAILSAILQTSGKLQQVDFSSVFQRMFLEIESIRLNPMTVIIGNTAHKVVVEIFQSILDMDASRKIHGLPIWLSLRSCSRCDVTGRQIKLKKGKTICWFPIDKCEEYEDGFRPAKLFESLLPPPWKDGFDGLHLMQEGTTRDLLKDLLGTGKKLNLKLKKPTRNSWAEALSKTKQAKGMSSSALLDPIQLASRTGSEVQRLYDISIPALLICEPKGSISMLMIFLHWITTRMILDVHLSKKQCEALLGVVPQFRMIVGTLFPRFYSMKFHFVYDHCVPRLLEEGSPLLTSAAPYERLNQVLGRSINLFTTRSVLNMSNKFISLQRASFCCQSAVTKMSSPVSYPLTMQSVLETDAPRSNCQIDTIKIEDAERHFIAGQGKTFKEMRTQIRVNSKTFSTRMSSKTLSHGCYVYYFGRDGSVMFGSLERVLVAIDDECFALVQQFKTDCPFSDMFHWAINENSLRQQFDVPRLITLCDKNNVYFRKIIGTEMIMIPASSLEGYYIMNRATRRASRIKEPVDTGVNENSQETEDGVKQKRPTKKTTSKIVPSSVYRKKAIKQELIYESDDDDELEYQKNNSAIGGMKSGFEEEDNDIEGEISPSNDNTHGIHALKRARHDREQVEQVVDNLTPSSSRFRNNGYSGDNFKLNPRTSFSISQHLQANSGFNSVIDKIKKEVESGNVRGIGESIINGIMQKTVSDVQLEELSHSLSAPPIAMSSYVTQIMDATLDDMKCIFIGQQFMSKLDKSVSTSIRKVEASIHSISTTIKKNHHIEAKKKKPLEGIHIIPKVPPFPACNLNELFDSIALVGDKAVNQLTNLFVSIFRTFFSNQYEIWVFSYRPSCPKIADRHFKPLPDQLFNGLCDFGFDVLQCYLPTHLLSGPIDFDDIFVQSLKEQAVQIIEHRRNVRNSVMDVVKSSISLALQTLRNYHYCLVEEKLFYCGAGTSCTQHLMWSNVKAHRDMRRKRGLPVDEYTVNDVLRSTQRSNSEPLYDQHEQDFEDYEDRNNATALSTSSEFPSTSNNI